MVLGVQILGILFGLFMLYYSFLHFKRKEFNSGAFAFWLIVWAVLVILSVFPGILDPLASSLSFIRVMDMLVVLGIMFIIGVTFYNFTITKKTERKVEELVRKLAIRKGK